MKPKYELLELIHLYKLNINRKENLMKIIECMEPIINRFVKKLYNEEYEDVNQELILAVIEAVNKIEFYDNEGGCVNFLINAIKNRFYELCRKQEKKKYEVKADEEIIELVRDEQLSEYDDIAFEIDLKKFIQTSSEIQVCIAYAILYEQKKDREIAENLGISRQYVNRCKKQMFSFLKEYSQDMFKQ